jgi:hypothetical protein
VSIFVSAGDGLVEAATRILERSAFKTEHGSLPGVGGPWLLAENEFFAIGVLAGASLHDLAVVDSVAAAAVLDRLGGTEGGAKRWDAYLVLLTSEPSRDADDRERVELVYNTRGVRRIVGQGLSPTDDSVGRVLTPFLPLRGPLDASLGDIGSDLADALAVNGVDQTRGERYVSAYLDTGTLDNV